MSEELPQDFTNQSEPVSEFTGQKEKAIQNLSDHMEVHHHPDLHHKKKRWKEYLLEFLMIFLAVTLGFFAESLREHITEKHRASIYARSLIDDLKSDTTTLNQLIYFTVAKNADIDSLGYFIHAVRSRNNDSLLYLNILNLVSTFQFDNINGTYEQIKNSGTLRFFDQSLVNDLNGYDATAAKLKLMEDLENKFLLEKINPQTGEMFNFLVFGDLRKNGPVRHELYLKKMNDASIDILINQAEVIKRLRERQLNQQRILLFKANEILTGLTNAFQN